MLFLSDIAWTVQKMVCIGLNVRLQRHKSFLIHYGLWGGEFLKCILTHLCFTKYNEINVCHSYIQKHASYKKWYK